MAINTDLLKRTLAYIETHPAEWDQGYWVTPPKGPFCGTAYCFAGHALVLAGITIHPRSEIVVADLPEDVQSRIPEREIQSSVVDGAMATQVPDAAAALLGIPSYWGPGAHLFDGDNTLDDLRRIVAELCGETSEAAV